MASIRKPWRIEVEDHLPSRISCPRSHPRRIEGAVAEHRQGAERLEHGRRHTEAVERISNPLRGGALAEADRVRDQALHIDLVQVLLQKTQRLREAAEPAW